MLTTHIQPIHAHEHAYIYTHTPIHTQLASQPAYIHLQMYPKRTANHGGGGHVSSFIHFANGTRYRWHAYLYLKLELAFLFITTFPSCSTTHATMSPTIPSRTSVPSSSTPTRHFDLPALVGSLTVPDTAWQRRLASTGRTGVEMDTISVKVVRELSSQSQMIWFVVKYECHVWWWHCFFCSPKKCRQGCSFWFFLVVNSGELTSLVSNFTSCLAFLRLQGTESNKRTCVMSNFQAADTNRDGLLQWFRNSCPCR